MTSPFVPAQSGETHVAVAVIDPDQTSRSRLAMQLGQGATPFPSIGDLAPRLSGSPVVLVLGPNCVNGAEMAAAEDLLSRRREIGALVVTSELSMEVMQRALRAGIRDVLQAPVDTSSLAEAVSKIAATLAPAAPSSSNLPAGFEVDGELGRVITVFSTKGGAGKSVIATNVAVLLAQRSEKPVVLIDADLQFGDIAVMLKLAPQHTIVDAVSALDRLDASLLRSLLVEHTASGLWVLPAPLEPAFADQIGAAEMNRIVELLRTFCEFVVVDTPAYFNDVVLGLIEVSDEVLLVAGMDIPNIKNVKIGLQTLRLLNTPMEKLRLVLNRANSKVKLDVGEVERTLSVKADALIPSEVAVPQSVNKGMPVVLSDRKAAVSRSLEQLADLFLPSAPKARRR
jgi:pilus assembly protein CpaE